MAGAAALVFTATPSRAALVDLDIYVTYSILDNTGTMPLVDGSWVFIIGSADTTRNGMSTYNLTNYIANTTIGDDVILGTVFIGDNHFANTGKFFTTVQYDTGQNLGYVYIRYFQTTGELSGGIWWGESPVTNLIPTNFGVVNIDAAPNASLLATNFNTFAVIPEPATAQLMVLAGVFIFAFRRAQLGMKKKRIPGATPLHIKRE